MAMLILLHVRGAKELWVPVFVNNASGDFMDQLQPTAQFCFAPWRPPLGGVPIKGAQQWYKGTTVPAADYADATRTPVITEHPWGYVGAAPVAAPVLITAVPPPCARSRPVFVYNPCCGTLP
jgi:hypothetical protein